MTYINRRHSCSPKYPGFLYGCDACDWEEKMLEELDERNFESIEDRDSFYDWQDSQERYYL